MLADFRPWLPDRPPINQFREQLDATVETIWAIHRATAHYKIANGAFRQLQESAKRVETALHAMEKSAVAPEMANFVGLLKLDEVRSALAAIDRLERDLARLPEVFSGQQKARQGPAARAWYSGFIRDLAKIAEEIGIDVTTGGDRSKIRTRRPSPILSSPSRSCCLTGPDRKRWRPARRGSIARSSLPKTRLMRRSRGRGSGEKRPAAG